jgi:hypothetical protein
MATTLVVVGCGDPAIPAMPEDPLAFLLMIYLQYLL